MSILSVGEKISLTLPEGKVLSIVANGTSKATVYQLDVTRGGFNAIQSWNVTNSANTPIGPFRGSNKFLITCDIGTISTDIIDADAYFSNGNANFGREIDFVENGNVKGQMFLIDGDLWILSNAKWDDITKEFYRIDRTKPAFGLCMQGQGTIPGEAALGFNISGFTTWVARAAAYDIIRAGGLTNGARYASVGGWELGFVLTNERNLALGGMSIELDGSGTFPYGRVIASTTIPAVARRLVGMTRNAYAEFAGADSLAHDSWYWGYVERYNPGDMTTVAGSPGFQIAVMDAGGLTWKQLLRVLKSGQLLLGTDNDYNGTLLQINGTMSILAPGAGIRVVEGSNCKQGVATLVAGTVVVSNTAVTANSRIFLCGQNSSGTAGELSISARTAGTSFTITSSSGTDTRQVAYQIFEPA